MDYQNKIKEIIYNNSEYFPFEWIRSFKMRNKSLPLADEEEKEYKFLQEKKGIVKDKRLLELVKGCIK